MVETTLLLTVLQKLIGLFVLQLAICLEFASMLCGFFTGYIFPVC